MEVKTFAGLLRFFRDNGVAVRTKSELVSEALDYLNILLVANSQVQEFIGRQDAALYIERCGLGRLDKEQGRRNLPTNLNIPERFREISFESELEELDDIEELVRKELDNV